MRPISLPALFRISYAWKLFSKYCRTACLSRLDIPAAWAQTERQLISLLRFLRASQLLSQADHACVKSSSPQPCKACQDTAVKLAIGELYGEVLAFEVKLGRFPDPRVGGVEQPTIKLGSRIANTLTWDNLNLEIMITNLLDEYPMLLFVMEGAIALGLLLFIVLWTGKGKK